MKLISERTLTAIVSAVCAAACSANGGENAPSNPGGPGDSGGVRGDGSGGSSSGGSDIDSGATAVDGGEDGRSDATDGGDGAGFDADSSSGNTNPYNDPNLVSLFDGTTLAGWVQVPANSWSVMGGAMHSLGTARGFIYSAGSSYGSFRWIYTERLLPTVSHQACTLIWGNKVGADALAAIQVQPPNGSMWDYRKTGPTANQDPKMFETRLASPNLDAMMWSQCETLADNTTGSFRFACCQRTGATPCRAVEILDFKDPAAVGLTGPVALQVHNAGMIEEFKEVYIESPVKDPTMLLTTQ